MIKEHRLIYQQLQNPNAERWQPDEMQELAMRGARTEEPSTVLNDVYNKTNTEIDSFFQARRENLKSLFQKGRKADMDKAVEDQLDNGLAAAHADAKLRVSLFTSYTSKEYIDLLRDHAEARLHTANLRADLDNLQSMQQASADAIRLLHTGDWFLKDTRVWLDIKRDRKEAGYGKLEKAKQKDTKKSEKKLGKLEVKKTKVEEAISKKMAKYETKARKFEDKARKYIEQRDQANDARLKIEHLERQLRQNPADTSVKKRLERERDKFQKLSETQMQKRDAYLKKTPYYNFHQIWKKTDSEAADMLARATSAAYHEYLRLNIGLTEDEATTVVDHLTHLPDSNPLHEEKTWKSLIRQNKDFMKFLLTGWYKGHSYTPDAGKNVPMTVANFEKILTDLHGDADYQGFARLGIRQFEKEMSEFVKDDFYKKQGLLGLLPYLKVKAGFDAIKTNPKNPNLYFDLAQKLASIGKHQQVIDLLNTLIKNAPNNKDAYTQLGNQYVSLRQYDDAEKAFKKVIELDPNDGHAHGDLGALFRLSNKKAEALGEYQKAVDLFFAADKFAECKDIYEKMLILAPDNRDLHRNLGHVLEALGETEAANKEYAIADAQ